MRIMYFLSALFIGLAGWSPAAVHAQSLKNHPGYVDFGSLAGLTDEDPKVEISLGRALLSFLVEASEEEDNELANALSKLISVRVSVFELDETKAESAREKAEQIVNKLEDDDWESVVTVRGDESTVHMYMKSTGDKFAGMTVMMIEPGSDAVFMNIVGEIDPAQLGRVAAKFGVSLDELEQSTN